MRNALTTDGAPGVYAAHLAYSVGERVPISQLRDETVQAEYPVLVEEGVAHCRVDRRAPAELAVAAAKASLDGLGDARPDAIVYCTDTPSGDASPTEQMWRFQSGVNLAETPAVLVSGGGCNNLGPGLIVARSLLLTEGITNVLFLTTDRVAAGTRYGSNGLTVLSDGAAACVLTTAPEGPAFRILGLSSTVRADADPNLVGLSLAKMLIGTVGQAVDRALAISMTAPTDCRYFITANYGRTPRAFLAMAAKCTAAEAFSPLVDDIAHCFSADVFINLATLVEREQVDAGDRLLLLSTSPRTWSAVVAEYAGCLSGASGSGGTTRG